MPYKDREKIAEWRERNKEKIKAQKAEWNERNKERKRAYEVEYRKRNKERTKARNAEYLRKNQARLRFRQARSRCETHARKFSLIQQLGGKCVRCGEDHPLVLDFHHQDPSVKEGLVTKFLQCAGKYKEAQEEAQKCILLCSNCHRKEHHELSWLTSFPGSDLYICPWEHFGFTEKKTKEKQEQEMEKFIDTQLNYSAPYLT